MNADPRLTNESGRKQEAMDQRAGTGGRPHVAEAIPGLSSLIFDWQYYVNANELQIDSPEIALDHFKAAGLQVSLDPSPFVSTAYVQFLAEREGRRLATVDDLFARLRRTRADDFFGWSPRVMPQWIVIQLLDDPEAFASLTYEELLRLPFKPLELSPHPALAPVQWPDTAASLRDFLLQLDDSKLESASLVDLQKYPQQHNDLAKRLQSGGEVFNHMWAEGLRENRMSYLGTTAPRRMSQAQLVRNALVTLYKNGIKGKLVEGDLAHAKLPQRSLHYFQGDGDSIKELMTFNPASSTEPPPLSVFLDLLPVMVEDGLFIIAKKPDVSLSAPAFVSGAPLVDRDLFEGSRVEAGQRVVYSINLGLYDDMPVPPQMEDCAYYMITDAASVPAHLPWRIVRPTIGERDRKRLCLWYKTHPHLLFTKVEHALWIDSNIECLAGSDKVIAAHEALAEVATFSHPDRDCIYEEAEAIAKLGLDDPEVIRGCVERMRATGMPAHNGLFETNVLYTRANDYLVRKFLDRWWQEIFLGSRRDQMSFTYAAFLTGIELSRMDSTRSAKTSRFFQKRAHRNAQGRKT